LVVYLDHTIRWVMGIMAPYNAGSNRLSQNKGTIGDPSILVLLPLGDGNPADDS
jgi:hypothetical protein